MIHTKQLIFLMVAAFILSTIYFSASISFKQSTLNCSLESGEQIRQSLEVSSTLVEEKYAKTKRCDINMLIISSPRNIPGASRFVYLERTLKSIIVDLQVVYLEVCTFVFNTDEEETVEKELRESINTSGIGNVQIIHREEVSNIYDNNTFTENPKTRKQSNDFYDMLKTFNKIETNGLVFLMEDDFEFCPNSFGHLMNILSKTKDKNLAGIRFSFGLNGIIIQKNDIPAIMKFIEMNKERSFPVDWLLEEFFHKHAEFGMEYFGSRYFVTYRYQLMKHIGVSTSIGNERSIELNNIRFPHCYELQSHSGVLVQFRVLDCPDSLFFPCPDEPSKQIPDFLDDTKYGDGIPASSEHGISELRKVKAILCEIGDNCNTCCEKKKAHCDGRFFPFINKCEEMKKHYPNCNCVNEVVIESRAPNFDGEICVIGQRRSRFRCENSFSTERRLCPCYSKDFDEFFLD